MNIKEAKEQIKNAMQAYFTQDEYGRFLIPIEKQRPVILIGPPGIGKTAVMEQIAQELGVGLVSYSMTHHTRQSALGLPFIVEKNYGGAEYSVSEYTMSEIIASVYETIESTGLKNGILFLDEINCVSETLAPSMLQFLQYKVFGRHHVPEGWIVVTAGNPPEYNNSVRNFDIVTWDRLKRIDVEPDYDVWKEYAYSIGAHPAVTTYLDIKKNNFYRVESVIGGKQFVTARGWLDLSDMLHLYEIHKIKVDECLIAQYLQFPEIAKDFAVYYDLFNKYKSDYQVDKILSGTASPEIVERAEAANFDERFSFLGLLLDGINDAVHEFSVEEIVVESYFDFLKSSKDAFLSSSDKPAEIIINRIRDDQKKIKNGRKTGNLSRDTQDCIYRFNAILQKMYEKFLITDKPGSEAFADLRTDYELWRNEIKKEAAEKEKLISNAFSFCEKAFGNESQEILILVTEITINPLTAKFISRYGCKEYFAHNKELLFYERQKEIIRELDSMDQAGS